MIKFSKDLNRFLKHTMSAGNFPDDKDFKRKKEFDEYEEIQGREEANYVSHDVNRLQDTIDKIGVGKFHLWIFFVIGFRFFINSIKQTQFALLEPQLKCYWHLTVYEASLLTMAFFAGLMTGNTFMGVLSDMYGRRKIMLLFSILETVILLLSALSTSQYYFLLTQLAIGICHSSLNVILTYFTELWPKDKRYQLSYITIFQFLATLFVAVGGQIVLRNLGWRWLIIVGEFILLFFSSIQMFSIPESPRNLFVLGNIKGAYDVLEHIAKFNSTTHDIKVTQTKISMNSSDTQTSSERSVISMNSTHTSNERCTTKRGANSKHFVDLFERKYVVKIAEISSLSLLACCLINFVLYISTQLEQLKLERCQDPQMKVNESLSTHYRCDTSDECYITNSPVSWDLLGIAFGYIPGTLLVYLLLRYFSRGTALMITFISLAVSLVPHYFCLDNISQSTVLALNIAFAISSMKIITLHSQESFPTRLRSTAFSIVMIFGNVGNVLGALFSQALLYWNFNISFSLILAALVTASILLLVSKKEPKDLALKDT